MTTTPRVFVSHSRQDDEFGLRLIADLRRDLGREDAVWYDVSGGLQGGDAWWRTIVREITTRDVFIVVLSPAAVASKWVEDEIDLAWQQKNTAAGKLIVPLLYRACDVRPDLATRQMIDFTAPGTYATAYAQLLRALGARANPTPSASPRALAALPPGTSRVIWCTPPDRDFARRFVGDLCAHDDHAILRVFDHQAASARTEDLAIAQALCEAHAADPNRCTDVAVVLSYAALTSRGFLTLLRVFDPDANSASSQPQDWPAFVTADADIADDFDAVAMPEWPLYDLGSDYAQEFARFAADAGLR